MSLSKRIRAFIERYLHLEIRSTVASKTIPAKGTGESNLYIAFTGVAGSGKSTLRRYYLKNRSLKNKPEIITYKPLQAYAKSLPDEVSGVYLRLLQHYLDYSQSDIQRKVQILKMDCVAKHRLHNKVILLDTRDIFREMPGIVSFLTEEKEVESFLENRILVHMNITPEESVKRILRRQFKTGKMHPEHHGLSNTPSSYRYIAKLIEEENYKVSQIELMGVPVLYLNAKNSLQHNSRCLNRFIQKRMESNLSR